jgi:hypothetical protein
MSSPEDSYRAWAKKEFGDEDAEPLVVYPAEWDEEGAMSVEIINPADTDPFANWPSERYRALCRIATMGGEKKHFLLTFPLEEPADEIS